MTLDDVQNWIVLLGRFFMKVQQQTSAELTKVGDLVEGISTAMLTFIDANQTLISQPMAPIEMDSSGAIWSFTDINSDKVKHLDKLSLSFSAESSGVYVSLSGSGELISDKERVEELWSPFVRPWFPDGPESPNLSLIKFSPHTAEYWDSAHSAPIRLFAMAASIIAAKPIGLGDHDKLNNL